MPQIIIEEAQTLEASTLVNIATDKAKRELDLLDALPFDPKADSAAATNVIEASLAKMAELLSLDVTDLIDKVEIDEESEETAAVMKLNMRLDVEQRIQKITTGYGKQLGDFMKLRRQLNAQTFGELGALTRASASQTKKTTDFGPPLGERIPVLDADALYDVDEDDI